MNCNLTDKDRKSGMRCRSWSCQPCKEYGVTKNDLNIIQTHMDNMTLKEEITKLKSKCERYEKALKFYADNENDNPDTPYNNESARQALSGEGYEE